MALIDLDGRNPEDVMGEVLDDLREQADAEQAPPSFESVRSVVRYLTGSTGLLSVGPAELGRTIGLTGEEVCDIVAGLGTWLGQSRKQAAGRAVAYDKAMANLRHSTQAEIRRRTGERRERNVSDDQLVLLPFHSEEGFVLPSGWERSAIKRELDRAVANIAAADPDDATLRRWMFRHFDTPIVVMSFEMLSMLWCFTRMGCIHEISDLPRFGGGQCPSLARTLADTWDVLDVSRSEAVAAVSRLCSGDPDPIGVRADIARARWLAEADFGRVEKAAKLAEERPSAIKHLVDELDHFAALVASDPSRLTPNRVADLKAGQIRRLAESIGLDTGDDSSLRREVSAAVSAAGLASDADRIIGLGVAAARAGHSDLFADALQRRVEGDLSWASDVRDALGAGV